MFGLLKDTCVVGKANALIQRPPKDIFDFVGANFLTNYPRWSPDGRSQLSRLWLFNPVSAYASKGYPTPTDAITFLKQQPLCLQAVSLLLSSCLVSTCS